MIIKGVADVKLVFYKPFTVLKRTIETMSLKTPSPKTHEYSFGALLKSMIDTAATTSEEHRREVNIRMAMNVIWIGIVSGTWLPGTRWSVYLVIVKFMYSST